MKVLVLGGTGYIGRAVVARLRAYGHTAVVVTRPGTTAAVPDGVATRTADLAAPGTLSSLVTPDIDAVIHAATPTGDWDTDLAGVRALLAPLAGSSRAFVYTSGVWVLGTIPAADETAPTRPIDIVSRRPEIERLVLTADLRGVVVRPGIVHGHGAGIPGMLVGWAREAGVGRYVADRETAEVRWPMVYVADLADLFVRAAERAAAGSIMHGVAEPGVPARELAEAADLAAGGAGKAEVWPTADAAAVLGAPFADALGLDQVVRAPAAAALGWRPAGPHAVDDLATGSYRS